MCVEAGLFCSSGWFSLSLPLYSCCGAGAQDSCGATLLGCTLKLYCWLEFTGFNRKYKRLPKGWPELLPKKGHFWPKPPKVCEKNTGLFIHHTVIIFFSKTPSSWAEETRGRKSAGKHKRSASWGSAEHLREASTCLSLQQFINQVFSPSLFCILPPMAWSINSPLGESE